MSCSGMFQTLRTVISCENYERQKCNLSTKTAYFCNYFHSMLLTHAGYKGRVHLWRRILGTNEAMAYGTEISILNHHFSMNWICIFRFNLLQKRTFSAVLVPLHGQVTEFSKASNPYKVLLDHWTVSETVAPASCRRLIIFIIFAFSQSSYLSSLLSHSLKINGGVQQNSVFPSHCLRLSLSCGGQRNLVCSFLHDVTVELSAAKSEDVTV